MDQIISPELKVIVRKIGDTKTYYQVDNVLNGLVNSKTPASIQFLEKLENQLEKLSPLTLTSSQWSSLRYALICMREINAGLKSPVL